MTLMKKCKFSNLLLFLLLSIILRHTQQVLLRGHLRRSSRSRIARSLFSNRSSFAKSSNSTWPNNYSNSSALSSSMFNNSSNSMFSTPNSGYTPGGTSMMSNGYSTYPYGYNTNPYGYNTNPYGFSSSMYNDPYGYGHYNSGGMCFPAKTRVITKDRGIIPIKQLTLNDSILTYSFQMNKDIFTPVIGWLHKVSQNQAKTEYLKVSIGNQYDFFYSSAYHSIILANKTFAFAKDLIGKQLYSKSPQQTDQKIVSGIIGQQIQGIYSPITQNYNYYVLSEKRDIKILAHCFSHLKNPDKYEKIFHTMLMAWQIINGKPSYQDSQFRIHPLAQILLSYFSMVLEGISK